jgi:hypothetical protein
MASDTLGEITHQPCLTAADSKPVCSQDAGNAQSTGQTVRRGAMTYKALAALAAAKEQ